MNVNELERKLRDQLAAIENPPAGFEVKNFEIWMLDGKVEKHLGEALLRVERKTWSWGSCRSDTCQHVSHDAYSEGCTAFVTCCFIGVDENKNSLYRTPGGAVFAYRYGKFYHFAPTAKLFIPG